MIKQRDLEGQYTAVLAISELGVGSLLHAAHLPLSGQLLSLNQGFLLCRLSQECQMVSAASTVSLATALLKSLSPAGKRLTPMLAISAQGLLFSLGLIFFGTGFVGQLAGIWLLSVWAFVQPLLAYYLIFGSGIIGVLNYFFNELQALVPLKLEQVLYIVAAMVVLKLALATAIAVLARRMSGRNWQRYLGRVNTWARNQTPEFAASSHPAIGQRLKLIGRDLLRPWFLLSFALSAVFFSVTSTSGVQMVWLLARPLAVAVLISYAVRFVNPSSLMKSRFIHNSRVVQAVRRAIQVISKSRPPSPASEPSR